MWYAKVAPQNGSILSDILRRYRAIKQALTPMANKTSKTKTKRWPKSAHARAAREAARKADAAST